VESCEYCGQKFKNVQGLKGHQRAKHGPESARTPDLSVDAEVQAKRSELELSRLDNALVVEQSKSERLGKPPDHPPSELDKAAQAVDVIKGLQELQQQPTALDEAVKVIGLLKDVKDLQQPTTRHQQPQPQPPNGLSWEQQLTLDIKRLESQERLEERAQEQEQRRVELRAETYSMVGRWVESGIGFLGKIIQESKVDRPSAAPLNRSAVLGKPPMEPSSGLPSDGPGNRTRVLLGNYDDVVPGAGEDDVLSKPADRPGGTWIASADAETGEVISWAWAKDPPPETVRERMQRLGQNVAGNGASRVS